jgi:hypothetical protein
MNKIFHKLLISVAVQGLLVQNYGPSGTVSLACAQQYVVQRLHRSSCPTVCASWTVYLDRAQQYVLHGLYL